MSSDSPHPTPHDALFKRVFGDVRRGAALLRSILPPVLAERVDWDSVQRRSGSYVDAKLKGLARDLVPDGVDARVRAATADELDRWAERVHTAESLDDVLR